MLEYEGTLLRQAQGVEYSWILSALMLELEGDKGKLTTERDLHISYNQPLGLGRT